MIDRFNEMDSEELAEALHNHMETPSCKECILTRCSRLSFCTENKELKCQEKIAKYLESECDW